MFAGFLFPKFRSFLPPVAFVLYHQASASSKGSCHEEQNLVCLDSPKAMEMHPDCKSPFFVQSVNVTKPTEWILRQKIPPQTDTHPQSRPRVAGRWLACWRRWEFPTCLGEEWRVDLRSILGADRESERACGHTPIIQDLWVAGCYPPQTCCSPQLRGNSDTSPENLLFHILRLAGSKRRC